MYESIEKELAITAEKARLNGYWFCSKHSEHWMTCEEGFLNDARRERNRLSRSYGRTEIIIEW